MAIYILRLEGEGDKGDDALECILWAEVGKSWICALKSLKNYLKPVEKYVLETREETRHEL